MKDLLIISFVFCVIWGITVAVQHEHDQVLKSKMSGAQAELQQCQAEVARKDRLLSDAFSQDISDRPVYRKLVTATAYTAREAECDATPWFTASMEPSRVGVLAVSRDLEAVGLTLGKTVVIKGMGTFRIEDRMNKRWKNRIDILHANLEAARRFAKRDVEIIWIGS